MERIKQMIEMQKALNNEILKTHNAKIDTFNLVSAIIDEIGELNHELKGEWCWWKKTQSPVDRVSVLEELVDLWHFAMTFHIEKEEIMTDSEEELIESAERFKKHSRELQKQFGKTGDSNYKLGSYQALIHELLDTVMLGTGISIINVLVVLTYNLDFTMHDVYQMYLVKNEINYKRIKENY